MSIDSIGDFLTIIRNGVMVAKPFVLAPYSQLKFAVAQILKDEGFIKDVELLEDEQQKLKKIKIILKYVDSESVIHKITRISRPGRRQYFGVKKIKPVIGKLGLSILSTNQGVITHKQAKKLGVGGEVICNVW